MSKIKIVACDICGKSVYQHARHQYQIRKRLWEADTLWKQLDLCEECWDKTVSYIQEHKK